MKRILMATVALVTLIVPNISWAYSYPGYKWDSAVVGYDTSGLGNTTWRSIATTAMSNWNAAGAKFQLVNSSGSQNTMSYYWDNSEVLAYNQRSRQYVVFGKMTKSVIKVNNFHLFNPPYRSGEYFDLASVLRHELGHTIPLDHVGTRTALMYPSFATGEVRTLTSDEINGIRAIYGIR